MSNTTDHLKDEIIKLYIEDKLSMDKIAKKFNLSICPIQNCLKKYGIPRRTLSEAAQEHSLNKNYFKEINTINKAQVLGMIYADGCLLERKGITRILSISLREPDEDYLEFIKKEIEYTGNLSDRISQYNSKIYTLRIASVELFNDMVNLGLTPRKSLTIDFPRKDKVPTHLHSHFIRGYMEGDGSVCHYFSKKKGRGRFLSGTVNFCGTIQFLEKLKEIIWKNLNINCVLSQKKSLKERNVNCHSLTISGNLYVLKFLEWVYRDANFVMPRKYKKYLELKENWEYKESIKDRLKEEFREKMSKITKGHLVSEETKEKCRAGNLIYSQLHRYKEVWIQNKEGIIYHVRGVKYFCKEFNLPYTYFCRAINPNNTKNNSCHGWRLYNYNLECPPENYIKKFY